jgi:hypothetical protein
VVGHSPTFVDVDRVPEEVLTVYITSRIAKYWEA